LSSVASTAFAHVEKRFFQVVSDLGREGYAREGDACYPVEVFKPHLAGDVFSVEIADLPESVWETGHYPEVYVVGACFAACKFEDAEF
jgi:hypothetical protein